MFCYGVDLCKYDFMRILWDKEILYYRKVYFNIVYYMCLNWYVFVIIGGVFNIIF